MASKDDTRKFRGLSLLIIASAIVLSYSNTFHASWHFDDFDNILTNQPLHISNLAPETLVNTFFANPIVPNQRLFHRPISNLTFALNWYWGGKNVWGYHFVNIGIHCVGALFLFLSILRLYSTPALRTHNKHIAGYSALLATLLWALNPIQTQAVTYIVQRMASLAAMFYIMAVYFYLRMRLTTFVKSRLLFFFCLLLSGLMAVGSKENTATLPIALFFIEYLFFREESTYGRKRLSLPALVGIGLTIIACTFFLNGKPLSFLAGYHNRPFTITERLLTEPRILITYLSQLFYPATFRLSLEHDIDLSKNFIDPWTTLPAIILIIFLLFLAIFCSKKQPLVSFSILFYFLNQLIESTVIPLELFFEHRNYLPSLFLFVPFADILTREITAYRELAPLRSRLLVFFALTLVIIFGTGTYIRNMSWISEDVLWLDAVNKAPASARARYSLGNAYLKAGRYDDALPLFVMSERLSDTAPLPRYARRQALNGIGFVSLFTDHPDRAIKFFKECLSLDPSFNLSRFNLTLALISLHKWNEAHGHIQKLLISDNNNADYIYMNDIIQLNLIPQTALPNDNFKRKTVPDPENANLYLLLATSYKRLGRYTESQKYLDEYNKLLPGNIVYKLALFDLFSRMNDLQSRDRLAAEIVTHFTSVEIDHALASPSMMGMQLYTPDKLRASFLAIKKTNP